MTLFLNKKLSFLLLGFVFFQAMVLAQEPIPVERSNNKVILEGTVYYIHVVKPGQTLYAISRAYNISQKEISIENPGVVSGIQVGQALKIPVEPTMDEEIDTSKADAGEELGKIHVVQPGETFYGIALKYGLKEEILQDANSGVDAGAVYPGQRLRIPEPAGSGQEPAYNEEGLAYHRVKRRETLYSIARFYQVTVQDIRTANPELGWGGPKTGQVVRIPLPQVIDHPDTILDTIPPDSIQFGVSDTILEDYYYEELRFQHDDPNRTYRIAFFVPFDFQVPEPLDSLIKDVKSVTRRNRIIERYMMEQKIPQSVRFLEFFQGALLAIDSIRQTGMKLDVKFLDTQRSLDHTLSILLENELEEFDLFIGPFHTFNLEIVSAFARKHKIPLVTPFYNELSLVRSNPYLLQLSPSIEREYKEAAKLVASKHMYNIVYLRTEDSLDVEKHNYFKQLIFDGFDEYRPEEPVIFKEVVQKLEYSEEIIHSLSPDRKNLVVVATRDQALASRVVSSLYFQLQNYDIEVLGTPYWTEFSSIDYRYFHKLNLIFYSSFWVDYLDPKMDDFMKKYRSRFYNEPTVTTRKGVNYGVVGYDITYYFLDALRINGSRFILSLDDRQPDLVQGPFNFRRVSNAGGYENENIVFYQFSPDMTISEFEVPEYPARHFFLRPIEDKRKRKYLNKDLEQE